MGDFMNDFNLCPNCGSKNIKNVKNRKSLCQDCGFDLYNNVASAVGLIICDKENKILLEERAKELIKIAHPDFREELAKAVEEYELW